MNRRTIAARTSASSARAVAQHGTSPVVEHTVGIVAVGRSTFDVERGATAASEVFAAVDSIDDVRLVGTPDVLVEPDDIVDALHRLASTRPAVMIVVFATFADNRVAQWADEAMGAPVLLWSVPEPRVGGRLSLNSLCGAQLAAFELRRRQHRFDSLHAAPEAPAAIRSAAESIGALLAEVTEPLEVEVAEPLDGEAMAGPARAGAVASPRARRLAHDLAGAVIGRIGSAPPGFTPCDADDATIERVTGMVVDRVELQRLFDLAGEVDDARLELARTELVSSGRLAASIPSDELERSLRLRAALAALIERRRWDAVAVRCWPECLDDYGAALCTPLALATAAGVPAVGEADVLGAVTSLVLRRMAGSDPFLTDLIDADPSDDTSAIWHCGCASPAWAGSPVEVAGHPIKGLGLANHFALAPGPVTVARLGRTVDGRLVWHTTEARLLARPQPFTGTSGVLRWPAPVDSIRRTLLRSGVEHHLVVVRGAHASELAELAAVWGIDHRPIARGAR